MRKNGDLRDDEKRFPTGKIIVISIAAAFVMGIIGGIVFRIVGDSRAEARRDGIASAPVIDEIPGAENTDTEARNEVSTVQLTTSDISPLVDSVMPTVVSIKCATVETYQGFFGQPYSREAEASGTGFIIGQDGRQILLATNNHVIENSKKIEVTFCDDTVAEAEVKCADEAYDLAVITVDVRDLEESTIATIKIAQLGDSDKMEVGDMTIAIGNALGYGQSVTVGHVSAVDREVTVDGRTMTLLQTDAAINPGNSGGPLLNIYGEVIGINSVKHASYEVEGIGYAIPTAKAVPMINELMNREDLTIYERGYLGISGKNIQSNYAAGFDKPAGVYVYSVEEGSPADKAGIYFGDIITAINGRTVASMEEISRILDYTRAGTTIEVTVKRLEEGEYVEKKLSVTLGNVIF
ncbi:MAG: trypsin-like peptidase domain-containing protein [Lachnospiraceae bacterium]|nr:trypsin-like peptidase domain-containing protein [Lachnospiraceae bacterium]